MTNNVISSKEATQFSIPGATKGCIYDLGNTHTIAVVETNGRYPEEGHSLNDVCTETIYLLDGFLEVEINGTLHRLENVGDVVVISPGNTYAIRGNGKAIDFITPGWDKSQNHIMNS